MNNTRRDFLKLTGLTGVGLLGSCGIEESKSQSTSGTSALDHIRKQSLRNHSQVFNMSGYAAPAIETVRIGIIGIGNRGSAAVKRLSYLEGVKINALCDVVPERAEKAKEGIISKGHNPELFTGNDEIWMEMCDREDLDLIYVTTPWAWHAPMGVYAMKQGKHTALEVPAAKTMEECWELVETSETTKKHCMILENCCYDFFEMLTLNLTRQGYFGEIVHTEGAYIHDLDETLFHRGNPSERWRLQENMERNGNLYPTHGLGPVAQIMNINRGNKMDYLVSTSTRDFSTNEVAKELAASDDQYQQFVNASFRGNMNTSTIKTALGQTILIQHDVSSPRPYSRLHLVSGTKGIAQKYPFPEKIAIGHEKWLTEDEMESLEQQYTPQLVNKMKEVAVQIGGHGGMDFLMDWRLIDCLRNGLPVDMDVYDAAAWSCIGPLSEWSVANRSAPIDIPDFTAGAWQSNVPHDISLQRGGTTGVTMSKS